MLGIEAKGQEGPVIIERIVMFLLISLSIAMLTICVTVLFGLKRKGKQTTNK
jgi:hypothetical protein